MEFTKEILFDEQFTDGAGAIAAGTRNADPGPGSWVVVDTVTGKINIQAGNFVRISDINAFDDPSLSVATEYQGPPSVGYVLHTKIKAAGDGDESLASFFLSDQWADNIWTGVRIEPAAAHSIYLDKLTQEPLPPWDWFNYAGDGYDAESWLEVVLMWIEGGQIITFYKSPMRGNWEIFYPGPEFGFTECGDLTGMIGGADGAYGGDVDFFRLLQVSGRITKLESYSDRFFRNVVGPQSSLWLDMGDTLLLDIPLSDADDTLSLYASLDEGLSSNLTVGIPADTGTRLSTWEFNEGDYVQTETFELVTGKEATLPRAIFLIHFTPGYIAVYAGTTDSGETIMALEGVFSRPNTPWMRDGRIRVHITTTMTINRLAALPQIPVPAVMNELESIIALS